MPKKIFAMGAGFLLFIILPTFVYMMTNNEISFGYNNGYQPTQPIPYSHKLHAGKLKIDCKYCHTGTETNRHALVPSVNICLNCHMTIKTDSEWIQKLQEHSGDNKPIVWNKVNLLPDHVKFNHSAHIIAGKQCQECHGPIETMEKVYQKETFSMGYCVNCHRKPENKAPTTCGTCHY